MTMTTTTTTTYDGDLDWICINTLRSLSIDMIEEAKSGHPGAPMGLAPLIHVLASRFLVFNPEDPKFIRRDRLILSNGHACALQYALLHLMGLLSLEDLRAFRQIDSKTPGHPESHITEGIEVTTGPLGQGVANAVGLAMAEAHLSATGTAGSFGNFTYVIAGDGCMQEGIASEAASLAGHLGLGKLILFYDDNQIQIDGPTDLAFTENVDLRFEAYGWHVQAIADGDADLAGIEAAILAAQAVTDKPSYIRVRTTIGYGSQWAGTERVHGAPLGGEEAKAVKTKLGLDPAIRFHVPDVVYGVYRRAVVERCQTRSQSPAVPEMERRMKGELPAGLLQTLLPVYGPSDPPVATRKVSEAVIQALAPHLPELIGGSADLTASNLTRWREAVDFQRKTPHGRYLRFGVREHAMVAICNGIAAYAGTLLRPFASTFLNFITYAWGAVRLSALSCLPVIFVMTHDSIGLGEDGPTHQPIEVLAALRALPGMVTVRPADGNETVGAYLVALARTQGPTCLCLSRQNLPQLAGSTAANVQRGAYVLSEPSTGAPKVVLCASGSEVALCVEAAGILAKEHGVPARVVSFPSWELFAQQPIEYRKSVIPPHLPSLSVEAGSTLGWSRWTTQSIGLDVFGTSGPYNKVYQKYGLTGPAIAQKALEMLSNY